MPLTSHRVQRWDLDKTYLETDFDSLRGLVRSAKEPASTKKATPGATALMRGLCADPDARVSIVSGRMGGLKPGETKTFRLPFDEIPESWNQALPQLVIAGVKFS